MSAITPAGSGGIVTLRRVLVVLPFVVAAAVGALLAWLVDGDAPLGGQS